MPNECLLRYIFVIDVLISIEYSIVTANHSLTDCKICYYLIPVVSIFRFLSVLHEVLLVRVEDLSFLMYIRVRTTLLI